MAVTITDKKYLKIVKLLLEKGYRRKEEIIC